MATEGSVKFDEALVKQVMYQLLYGLAHMHKHGFMHRDLKPENLLTTGHPTTGDFTVKLADFGLARELRARPPYTEYVSTRWYRAPEVLLRFTSYSSPIDTFGAGMIMGELLAGQPLAPGTSEVNQMYLLCDLLGTPSQSAWPEGYRQAEKCGFRWPTTSSTGGALSDGKLTTVCPGISPTGLQFLTSLLAFNPAKRPTPAAALGHEWFADLPPDTLGMCDLPTTPSPTPPHAGSGAGGGSAPPSPLPATTPLGSTTRHHPALAAAGAATLTASASTAGLQQPQPLVSPVHRSPAAARGAAGMASAASPGLRGSATVASLPRGGRGGGSLAAAGGVAVSGKARPHADPDIDLQRLTDLHSSASAAEFTAALDALLVDMPSPGKPSEPAPAPAPAAAPAPVAEQPRAAAEGGSGVQGGQGGSPGSGVDLEGSLSIEALLEQLAP